MKKKVVFVLLIVALMMVSAVAVASADAPTTSTVYWWWGDHAGSSRIVRTDSGISGNLSTSLSNSEASTEGLAVTLWLVVFNVPGECATSPCGEPDLFNPDVKADVLYGAGNVVGGSEKISLGFHVNEGDTSGSLFYPAYGVINAQEAEIHYVLRSHGPKVPANMPDQINSFGGGCEVDFPMPTGEDDLHLGEGECQDIQFAINLP